MSTTGGVSGLRRRWTLRRRRNFHEEAWKGLAGMLRGQWYWDRGSAPKDTVFLAGQGRSGTTWISEILNANGEHRVMDEPFHPGRLRQTRVFPPRPYLRPGDRTPRFVEAAEAVVSGRVRSVWIDRYNRRPLPSRRLIKETRANLLLPWLHASFPDMPMILLVRHPCAVVSSQFRLAGHWPVDLTRFLAQEALVQDWLAPFRPEIERAAKEGTEFERHLFAWCIDYLVPLRHFRPGDVHIAFYERFCFEPEEETRRLFAYLGRVPGEKALERLRRPSATVQKDSAVLSGEDLVNRWRRDLTAAQIDRAMEILHLFGLDAVYGRDSVPLSQLPEAAAPGA